ncbi:MAG: HAD family hydrolase [Chromatiaceae bacterium]|nr:MAG: HAD family hydrolase [Chromatiaceae bacterium]
MSQVYRLITLDLDDTLWPCAPVIAAAEAALQQWLREQAPRLAAAHDPDSLRAHRMALMRVRPEIAHDLTRVRRESLAALLRAFGYAEDLADAAMLRFRQARNRVEPYADVIPVLGRLRQAHRLVSVTNGNAQLAQTPLRDCFDRALTAAEVGAARPDPALFEQAMAWAGVGPAATLHVGDDPRCDIEAARRIGITAVWINRNGRAWPRDLPPPAHQVSDLHGLAAWLAARAGAP